MADPAGLHRRRRAPSGWSRPTGGTLQKRSPSSLKILTGFGLGSATGGTAGTLSLTYGADLLWLSQATPNDLGQINEISSSSGLVKGAVSTIRP